ncbi:733_t:CDS:2 [Funneliformis mosseae]|uniref:733_t:CDS:1 n=1 Tax=Funneliformis mosseae TaxID=27381 RepID=A0A9N9GG04_FUNMO|nr:733_t:CDS:2 [Funneliformis mosseae]
MKDWTTKKVYHFDRFIGELKRQGNSKGSDLFSIQEMRKIATENNIQFDNFQGFIDYINEQNLLLKKGPGTFQLRVCGCGASWQLVINENVKLALIPEYL